MLDTVQPIIPFKERFCQPMQDSKTKFELAVCVSELDRNLITWGKNVIKKDGQTTLTQLECNYYLQQFGRVHQFKNIQVNQQAPVQPQPTPQEQKTVEQVPNPMPNNMHMIIDTPNVKQESL